MTNIKKIWLTLKSTQKSSNEKIENQGKALFINLSFDQKIAAFDRAFYHLGKTCSDVVQKRRT